MDRQFVYPSQQPTDTLFLTMERNKAVALGYLAQGVLGTSTVADGLACIPTVPASLAVQVGPGQIYQQEPLDSVAYGSLGTDTVDQIIKQGVALSNPNLTLTPPSTSGYAINYLIEAELIEQDTGTTVLSYFNSANPSVPFTGPNGSGASQPTVRQCTVSLVAKAGVPATAGTQVTPTPDVGYVGLWVVTVAQGATALTSSQISQYSAAPFISVKLPQVPAWVQGGSYAWGIDTGTANQLVIATNPVTTTFTAGFTIRVKKTGANSTTAMTAVVNGASAISLVEVDGSAMSSTQVMNNGYLAELVFDGTSWRFVNSQISTAVGSLGASSGEGVTVSGTGVVSLNYPGLSVETTLGNTDLWSFFSQADTHHRVLSWSQLIAAIWAQLQPLIPAPLQGNYQQITSTLTFTVPSNVYRLFVRVWAAGGGGGGVGGIGACAGGGGGEYAEGYVTVTPGQMIVCTVGTGGAGGYGPNDGAAGGASSFGSYITCLGGFGGPHANAGQLNSAYANGGSGGTGGGFRVPGGISEGGLPFDGGGSGGSSYSTSISFSGAGTVGNGATGNFPGGGGTGVGNTVNSWLAGGNGAGGLIILQW